VYRVWKKKKGKEESRAKSIGSGARERMSMQAEDGTAKTIVGREQAPEMGKVRYIRGGTFACGRGRLYNY